MLALQNVGKRAEIRMIIMKKSRHCSLCIGLLITGWTQNLLVALLVGQTYKRATTWSPEKIKKNRNERKR